MFSVESAATGSHWRARVSDARHCARCLGNYAESRLSSFTGQPSEAYGVTQSPLLHQKPLCLHWFPHLQIKFSTKSFGIQAAEVAAEAIENVSGTLVDADISDIIAGRPEKEVIGALEIIGRSLAKAKLRSLDLSDNALGRKGILACAAAFKDQAMSPPRNTFENA